MTKTVSVAWELAEIQAAVEAARILVDGLRHQQFGTEHDEQSAPGAASATLSLVVLRLREVTRAIQGNVNPGTTVWAHFNGTQMRPGDQEDMHLPEWSTARLLNEAEQTLARARAAAARKQPGRRGAKRRGAR